LFDAPQAVGILREWHLTEAQAVAAVQRQAEQKRRRGYQ
jgi:hypothetical protein